LSSEAGWSTYEWCNAAYDEGDRGADRNTSRASSRQMADLASTFDTVPIHVWLIEGGLAGVRIADLHDGLCKRLAAAGFPLTRSHLSFATLHPLQWATGIVWQDGRIAESIELPHGYENEEPWLVSPFRHMLKGGIHRLHRRLEGGDALDFPVLRELREAGMTDWLALFHNFGWALEHNQVRELGVISSWATSRIDGWAAEDLTVIEELMGTVALAVKASSSRDTARDLLATYLGQDAAGRVIAGRVRRGSVERIAAVMLYADLRGFTDFAESAVPEEITRRLNDFFDCLGEPIRDARGEILKFLGDGLLAVFRADAERDLGATAAATLTAAREILARLDRLNDAERSAGNPPLAVDLALHEGEVTYGNVGTADRLDFTVIGPAVNEVSRLESLCKELGQHLLISDSFVRAAPELQPRLRSLGRHRLRGVSEMHEVFTIV
jgi:adenylate cyclase